MGRFVFSSPSSVFVPLLGSNTLDDRIRHLPQAPCIIIVPTHRQVEHVLRAWVSEHGGGEPPIVETMAGFYRRLGGHVLSDGPTILHERTIDVLLSVILQRSSLLRSIGMEAQKLVRWTQYGLQPSDVQEMSEAAGEHTRKGRILSEVATAWTMLLTKYEGGSCDRGAYARVLQQRVHALVDNPLRTASNDVIASCVMLDTHGVTVTDRALLYALADIGWDVGIAFADECPLPPDLAIGFRSATADDAAWFVANGWEHNETPSVEANYDYHSSTFATREEEVRRIIAAIKQDVNNGVSLRDIAVCVPGASTYRQIIVDVARRSGLPLEMTSIQPLIATHAAAGARCVCDVVTRNWLRTDVERLSSHDALIDRIPGLADLIAVMQKERFLGGTSLEQWGIALNDAHSRAREQVETVTQQEPSSAVHAQRWLRSIENAVSALNTLAERITLRADARMDAAMFTARLRTTIEQLGFTSDEAVFRALNDELMQYTSVSERFSLPHMTHAEHVALWWSMMEGASPLATSEPGRGVAVLAPAELRCKGWKRVYVVGMVEGEFPRAQEHMLDREIIPGVLDRMYVQSMMDIVNAVTSGGRLVCTRPHTIDEAVTIPSTLLEIPRGLATPNNPALDASKPIALYYHELPQDFKAPYKQPQTVHVRSIENKGLPEEIVDSVIKELERPVSPSRLDVMISCPYTFYVQKLLRIDVDVRSDETLTPLERGTMLHDVAAKFFQSLQPRSPEGASERERLVQSAVRLDPSRFEFYWEALKDLAHEHMRMQEWKHTFADVERQALLGSKDRPGLLRQWLASEIAYQQATGHAPVLFELPIERTLHIAHPDGTATIAVSTRVDRVDVAAHNDGITFIVNDYKTAVETGYTLKEIIDGKLTQMPIYLEAVRQWFEERGIEARPWAAIYRSFGKHLHKTEEPQNKIAMRDPEFVIEKNTPGVKQPLWKKNVGEFADKPLLIQNEKLLDQIAEAVKEMRGGDFAVRPAEKACEQCNFNEICRVEQWGTA